MSADQKAEGQTGGLGRPDAREDRAEIDHITAWMAGTPGLLLSTNFGVPESIFEKFPKDAVIMPEQG